MEDRFIFRAWNGHEMLTMPLSTFFGIHRFFGLISSNAEKDITLMQSIGRKDKGGATGEPATGSTFPVGATDESELPRVRHPALEGEGDRGFVRVQGVGGLPASGVEEVFAN